MRKRLWDLAKLVDEGEKYGLPVLAVTAVEGDDARRKYLGLASRICVEMGAHMIRPIILKIFLRLSKHAGMCL